MPKSWKPEANQSLRAIGNGDQQDAKKCERFMHFACTLHHSCRHDAMAAQNASPTSSGTTTLATVAACGVAERIHEGARVV